MIGCAPAVRRAIGWPSDHRVVVADVLYKSWGEEKSDWNDIQNICDVGGAGAGHGGRTV